MPRYATGVVARVLDERPGLQRVEVDLDGSVRPAYVLTGLIGSVAAGDAVVVNRTAVDLGLGTGGWDVVHWNLARPGWSGPGGGHVLKLRYTSVQTDVGVAEEHGDYRAPAGLDGRPVVVCALHSQLAGVAATFADSAGAEVAGTGARARLVYVMTDGAALPAALSELVSGLVERGLVAATVSAGQAFGADHEAVNLASALEVAVARAGADAIVVAPGPGGVGTDTPRGFTGLEAAGAIDAAADLGGRPVVAVRWSDADARPRHRGVSHHTATCLASSHRAALVAATGRSAAAIRAVLGPRHRLVEVPVPPLGPLLQRWCLSVDTMGRTVVDDPGAFELAGAAGVVAARLSLARPGAAGEAG